jgi:hypothetical protein
MEYGVEVVFDLRRKMGFRFGYLSMMEERQCWWMSRMKEDLLAHAMGTICLLDFSVGRVIFEMCKEEILFMATEGMSYLKNVLDGPR